MPDEQSFSAHIEARLAAAQREPLWDPEAARRYMEQYAPRRAKFEELTARLTRVVVRPRVQKLAGYFPTAALDDRAPAGRCICWFGY